MKSYLKVLYQPLLGLLLVLFLTTALSSCEDHEPIDPNVHIGYVLCDDHSCMDTTTYFNQSKRKAVGVVFAEQTEEHPALVVMFKEVNEIFCDSIGLVNGTSGDVSTFDGYSNTVAMYNSYIEETGKGSPLAMKMMDFHENGQSDFIPSVAEQRLLVAAARQINPIIERFGGTPIALNGDCWYWTSTEVTENAGLQAWLCSAVNGGILPTPKTESHKARAVVEIHYPE